MVRRCRHGSTSTLRPLRRARLRSGPGPCRPTRRHAVSRLCTPGDTGHASPTLPRRLHARPCPSRRGDGQGVRESSAFEAPTERREAVSLYRHIGGKAKRPPDQRFRRSDDRSQWGDRRDSNPRHPGPQPGALPTELRPPCSPESATLNDKHGVHRRRNRVCGYNRNPSPATPATLSADGSGPAPARSRRHGRRHAAPPTAVRSRRPRLPPPGSRSRTTARAPPLDSPAGRARNR